MSLDNYNNQSTGSSDVSFVESTYNIYIKYQNIYDNKVSTFLFSKKERKRIYDKCARKY